MSDRLGQVRGQHYSTFAPQVSLRLKLKKLGAAETLLRELIEAFDRVGGRAGYRADP